MNIECDQGRADRKKDLGPTHDRWATWPLNRPWAVLVHRRGLGPIGEGDAGRKADSPPPAEACGFFGEVEEYWVVIRRHDVTRTRSGEGRKQRPRRRAGGPRRQGRSAAPPPRFWPPAQPAGCAARTPFSRR